MGYQSQLTMHTSISSSFSTLTSYSVYQIDEDQISLNKDRPLGEGNFGIVFKGVWTKSNGDWEGTPYIVVNIYFLCNKLYGSSEARLYGRATSGGTFLRLPWILPSSLSRSRKPRSPALRPCLASSAHFCYQS